MHRLSSTLTFMVILLSGCGEEFLRKTSSSGFDQGYKAGCANGSNTASNMTHQTVRDDQRYLNDAEYARGWRAGNRECNGQNFSRNPNDSTQPVDVYGTNDF